MTNMATGSDLLSLANAWDRIDPRGSMASVSTTSRLLTQLMGIATGDNGQLLACRGSFSGWVALYASVVFGLEVELRAKGVEERGRGRVAENIPLGDRPWTRPSLPPATLSSTSMRLGGRGMGPPLFPSVLGKRV